MSGKEINIQASDGGSFMGYLAMPESGTGPGVVVIQEIFGVNDDIRETVDNFAKEGYVAIAPALFDRHERNAVLEFNEDGMAKGRALKGELAWDDVIKDVDAAIETYELMSQKYFTHATPTMFNAGCPRQQARASTP